MMERDSLNGKVLEYLYERYKRCGDPTPGMLSLEEWTELEASAGSTRAEIGIALEELARDGYAAARPRPGAGLHPQHGFIGLGDPGRHLVERWRNPAPPPDPLPVEVSRFAPEALDQLSSLFARLDDTTVNREQLNEVKNLLIDLKESKPPTGKRLETAERLVSLIANSPQLVAACIAGYTPIADLIRHLPT